MENSTQTSLVPMTNVLSQLENSKTQISSHISQTSRRERVEKVLDIFILRRTEDARLTQPDPILASIIAESYEKHLTNLGVRPEDYNKVYESAILLYNEEEVKGPFGIDQILQGANKFLEVKNLPKIFTKQIKEKVECKVCNSTGLQFDEEGKIVYEKIEGKSKAVKCQECYDEQ